MVNSIQWTPQLVNKFWDGVAQTELDNLSFGKVAGPQFLELISDYLVQGRRYLDFGAGSGHVLQLLLDRGLNAAGFDPSPDRQSLLLEKIGQHKNFLGVKGTESDEQFDVVLLMEVIEHILDEDFSSVLDRVSSFVKPGGYLIVSTPNNENLEISSVYCPVSDTFFHPWQHVRSFTSSHLVDCFKQIGFTKDFVALADFSCDAALIENYKKTETVNVNNKNMHERLIVALQESIKKYQLNLKDLNQIDSKLKSQVSFGIWQNLKLRLEVLRNHRSLIARVFSISHNMAHHFDEFYDHVSEQLRQTMPIEAPLDVSLLRSANEIDLRIGKETTIIYVGKKNDV